MALLEAAPSTAATMIRARRSSSRTLSRKPAQPVQSAGDVDHQAQPGEQARPSVQPQITHARTFVRGNER